MRRRTNWLRLSRRLCERISDGATTGDGDGRKAPTPMEPLHIGDLDRASSRVRVASLAHACQRLPLPRQRLRPWPMPAGEPASAAVEPHSASHTAISIRQPMKARPSRPCLSERRTSPAIALSASHRSSSRPALYYRRNPHISQAATSHRKVFVTRHISIDDGPTAPRHIPPPTPCPSRVWNHRPVGRVSTNVQLPRQMSMCAVRHRLCAVR